MGGKIILFLILLLLLTTVGLLIRVDSRVSEVNRELEIKISAQQSEIEQLQKKQRITAQDVDFLERLVLDKE